MIASIAGGKWKSLSCYSIKHRLCFLHIPKNGGTALRIALKGACPDLKDFDAIDAKHRKVREPALANHFPIWRIQQLLEETGAEVPFGTMRTFMVVRNPWERMVSLYRHRMRKLHLSYEGQPRNTPEDIRIAQEGFVPWLLTTPSEGDKVLTRMAQAEWGKNRKGQYCVERVLRQERLTADWLDLTEEWGLPPTHLKRANVGNSSGWREAYTDEAREHVAHYFAEDIRRYGYEF